MVETKLNIIICGLTSDISSLFISLYQYLQRKKYNVALIAPEYSGAVCLANKKISFKGIRDIYNDCNETCHNDNLLYTCLKFDLEQVELFSY